LLERLVEEVAGVIAGEGSPGAVCALEAGGEADDQQAGVTPAERGDRRIEPVGLAAAPLFPERLETPDLSDTAAPGAFAGEMGTSSFSQKMRPM